MKKLTCVVTALLMAVAFSGCATTETTSSTSNTGNQEVSSEPVSSSNTGLSSDTSSTNDSISSVAASSTNDSISSAPEADSSAPADEKNIKIASYKLSTDYNGDDVLVVEYEWTNTEDEATNFMTTFTDAVYQNGVECSSMVVGCDDVDAQQQMNDIQPGVTYTVAIGYLLQDKTNANVVVSEIFGDEIINEIIDLGGGAGSTPSVGDIAETSIKIAGHSLSKDYNGDDVLVVNYEFYNGEESAEGFSFMFTDKAYQNGVECDSNVVGCDDVDTQTQLNEIQPGTSYTVTVGYHISDNSDVEIEVKDLFGTTDYLSETISLS